MKFNRLRLTNIGAFYGNYDFDLTVISKERNVILFGGKNGSGKTTILEAIRLVLFGTFAFGLKTESAVYYEKIDAKLNTLAKKNHDRLFQIILDLEMVENLKRNFYTLKRSWVRQKNNIKEHFIVYKNDQPLNEREIEIFQSKLREETPPQLLEFCLFDGERISQVVSSETLSSYLSQSAKVMFNLDLFENLEIDLRSYIKQDSIFRSLSDEEKKILQVEQERDHLLDKKNKLISEFEQIDKILDEKAAALNELSRQFEVHGGLVRERREALIAKVNDIEHRRLMMMEKNKEYISTLLPFVLIRDLLQEVIEQMQKEVNFDIQHNVKQMISTDDLEEIIKPFIDVNHDPKVVSSKIYDQLLNLLCTDSVKIIHNSSALQRAEVMGLYQKVLDFNPEKMLNDFKENTKMIKEVQALRKQIEENDASSDLKQLLDSMHNIQNEISSIKLRSEQLQIIFNQIQEQLITKEQEYQTIKNKIIQTKKVKHVFEIATKVIEVSRLFRERQMKKKLQQVELEAARMLQLIFRKELFVTRVKIHPETFQLKIFDASNEEINIEILSAGEKQILLLATVWAMAMCSKRRLPFVFDTLLGRLDQTHKKSIIQHFIPRCGEQVIILSTDSEINEEYYQDIKKMVAKQYTIDFDTKKFSVQVYPHYFNIYIDEEESIYEL